MDMLVGTAFTVAYRDHHIRYTVIDIRSRRVTVLREAGVRDGDTFRVTTTHRPTWRADAFAALYATREM
jgi:hypothetical protein